MRITDRHEIETMLRREPALHTYELGDLSDFFWPHTTWYADAARQVVALLYGGGTLILHTGKATEPAARALLAAVEPDLPEQFVGHLSGSLHEVLVPAYRMEPHGPHWKMALTDPSAVRGVPETGTVRLSEADLSEITDLYTAGYPGNWFDPRMLETGLYVGAREGDRLAAVAGVHVYSAEHRVAALGNIATHPAYRGRGLATRVCARLCRELLKTVDHIGLHVARENKAAIACYGRLGFTRIAGHTEARFTRR